MTAQLLSYLAFCGFFTGFSSQLAIAICSQKLGNIRHSSVVFWYIGSIVILCASFIIAQVAFRRRTRNDCEIKGIMHQSLLCDSVEGESSRISRTDCLIEALVGSFVLVSVTAACILVGGGQTVVQNLGLLFMGESCIFFILLFQSSEVFAVGSNSHTTTRPADEITFICCPNLAQNDDLDDEARYRCCSNKREISLFKEVAFGSMVLAGVSAAGICMGGPWVENLAIFLVAEICILAIVLVRPQGAKRRFRFTISNETASDLPLTVLV